MSNPPQHRLGGLCIGIVLTDGFEQAEMTGPRTALEESGAVIRMLSDKKGQVRGVHHDQPGDLFDGVVLQNKQHLAALVASGQGLVLNLLRWGDEIRSWEDLVLPPEGPQAAGVNEHELALAKALIEDMRGKWDPHQFSDSFKEEILALVERKVKAGQLQPVAQPEAAAQEPIPFGAQILDLSDLLQRSLRKDETSDAPPDGDGPKRKSRARALPGKKKSPAPDGNHDTSPQSPGRRKAA